MQYWCNSCLLHQLVSHIFEHLCFQNLKSWLPIYHQSFLLKNFHHFRILDITNYIYSTSHLFCPTFKLHPNSPGIHRFCIAIPSNSSYHGLCYNSSKTAISLYKHGINTFSCRCQRSGKTSWSAPYD